MQSNADKPAAKNSMSKVIGIIIAVLIIGAILIFAKSGLKTDSDSGATLNTNSDVMVEDDSAMMEDDAMKKTISLSEVSTHDSPEDCWFAIEGKVYDVTSFIESGNHGGGDAILEGCGLDATTLYETRPMGSGTPHSDKARGFLPNFYIGDLQ